MMSRDPGVSRFHGCLFMFLAICVVSIIFPLVLFFFFFNGMGPTVFFYVIPVLYVIFINVYCFLLVGRERNQESIEEEELLPISDLPEGVCFYGPCSVGHWEP
jgi:hypothetical protein